MTLFDLVFVAVFLGSVVTAIAAAVAAVRGRSRSAVRTLCGLGASVATYLAVVALVSLASPARAVGLGEERCFDDWCISVESVDRTAGDGATSVTATLRLSSRARRRAQRERGVRVYVLDDRGRRFEPVERPGNVPLDVRLEPGESITTTRTFELPADVSHPGLVVAHGRFPGIFIVGDDESLFHKPARILFD